MVYYFFLDIYFRKVPLILKKYGFLGEKFWFTLCKLSDLLTAKLFFKLCISQRYVHILERNRKNSVCIRVKNFAIF